MICSCILGHAVVTQRHCPPHSALSPPPSPVTNPQISNQTRKLVRVSLHFLPTNSAFLFLMTFYAFDVNSLQSPIKCYAFYWKDSIKIRTVLCNIWSSPSRNTDIHPVTQNCTRMNEIQRERYGGGGG